MRISYENADIADIDGIFELEKGLINDYETNQDLDFEKIFDWVRNKVETNIVNYKCVFLDRVKVGYFLLLTEGEKLELDGFFIFREFQGKGIGTKVLEYVDSVAKEQNKDVFLCVFAKNDRAINLYLRNGFKIVENINGTRYIMIKSMYS